MMIDRDQPCFAIGIVARMVGLHAQTLRYYEGYGDSLHIEVPVPLFDAVLGGEVHVPTPGGATLALNITP